MKITDFCNTKYDDATNPRLALDPDRRYSSIWSNRNTSRCFCDIWVHPALIRIRIHFSAYYRSFCAYILWNWHAIYDICKASSLYWLSIKKCYIGIGISFSSLLVFYDFKVLNIWLSTYAAFVLFCLPAEVRRRVFLGYDAGFAELFMRARKENYACRSI